MCCIQPPKLLQEKIQNSNSHVLTPPSTSWILITYFSTKLWRLVTWLCSHNYVPFVYIKPQHLSIKEGSYIIVFTLKAKGTCHILTMMLIQNFCFNTWASHCFTLSMAINYFSLCCHMVSIVHHYYVNLKFNLSSININIMNMKRLLLICLFMFMLNEVVWLENET